MSSPNTLVTGLRTESRLFTWGSPRSSEGIRSRLSASPVSDVLKRRSEDGGWCFNRWINSCLDRPKFTP